MKIALLTDGITPYVIGGMQKHSFYLAKYLAQQGVAVDLYHTNKSSYDISKLEFFTTEEKKQIRSFVIDFIDDGKLPGHYIRASYAYSEKIVEAFKKNSLDADFIYAKGFSAWKLLEEKKKGLICAPIGVNFHGYEMFQQAPDIRSRFEQRFLLQKPVMFHIANADCLFSYGGKITEIIQELTTDHEKIIEIPTGIEKNWLTTTIRPAHAPLKFIFVGRYERRKGIQELNTVLERLSKKFSFTFDFVGPIPSEKQLKGSHYNYHGSISEVLIIKELLQESDVLVCPSHSEGMPNVIVEAMASGLAIIASDVGAVSRLVSSSNGLLTEAGSIGSLEKALVKILEMKKEDIFRLKAASSQKVADHFLWDTIILETMKKINDFVKKA